MKAFSIKYDQRFASGTELQNAFSKKGFITSNQVNVSNVVPYNPTHEGTIVREFLIVPLTSEHTIHLGKKVELQNLINTIKSTHNYNLCNSDAPFVYALFGQPHALGLYFVTADSCNTDANVYAIPTLLPPPYDGVNGYVNLVIHRAHDAVAIDSKFALVFEKTYL